MLNQIALADAFTAGGIDQAVDHLPLVVAGEDQGFFGGAAAVEVFDGFLLKVQKAAQYLEPSIRLKQLLPQVAGGVGDFIGGGWVA